jgi:hypothetical protein
MPIDCFGARLPLEDASASLDLVRLEAPDVIAERRFPPPCGERTFDGLPGERDGGKGDGGVVVSKTVESVHRFVSDRVERKVATP